MIGGLLIVLPIWVTVLLSLKAIQGALAPVAPRDFTEAKPEEIPLIPSPATGEPGSLTARLLERPKAVYTPGDLLKEIQWTRYRAGLCTGNYLERIHYLNEWFIDNEARGNVKDITRALGGAVRLKGRESREMTVLWKGYRYLRNNPSLRPQMARIEAKVNELPVWYIPKADVAKIESKLADGDIAGIVTKDQGGVCSHVGLITRTNGQARFMHASKNHRQVVLDQTISQYLNAFRSHAGLIVARPLSTGREVTSRSTYEANLRSLGA